MPRLADCPRERCAHGWGYADEHVQTGGWGVTGLARPDRDHQRQTVAIN